MSQRVFVCSPLRGRDGQPTESNIKLARLLMKAVFDAGHAPFVPHLLYPQVLSESVTDLDLGFAANFAYLDVCDKMWVYANDYESCSFGMKREVLYVISMAEERVNGQPVVRPVLVFMPTAFERVREAHEHEQLNMIQHIAHCAKCERYTGLNSQRLCLACFAGDT